MAVSIIATGLFFGASAMSQSVINSVNQDKSVVATGLAEQEMENIFADKAFIGFKYPENKNYPAELMQGEYTGYKRIVSVTEVDKTDFTTPEEGSGIKLIEVEVQWGNESHQRVKISSLITDY